VHVAEPPRVRAEWWYGDGRGGQFVERKEPRERLRVADAPMQVDVMRDAEEVVAAQLDLVADVAPCRSDDAAITEAADRRGGGLAVRRGDQQVAIGPRPQRGIRVVTIGERRALHQERPDAARRERRQDARDFGAPHQLVCGFGDGIGVT
jgi:hypothetical protein